MVYRDNAEKISKMINLAEKLNVKELIVTGMKPAKGRQSPTLTQMTHAAETIKKWSKKNECMKLTVESCFSPLRAFMEGSDAKKNANRGIERGCTAGRDHFCVLPSGKVVPCAYLDNEEEYDNLAEYWNESSVLKDLRISKVRAKSCEGCSYKRRCLPCPAASEKIASCPISAE